MEFRNYSDYSLQELYDLYNSLDKENNPAEARYIYEQILLKEKEGDTQNLASLGDRLGASIIDGLILGIPVLLVIFLFLGLSGMIDKFTEDRFTIQLYMLAGVQILYLSVNGWLLYKNGQTLGKKFLGIKIMDLKNNKPGLATLYGLRYFIPTIIGLIPFLGSIFSLVDILFIFRKDRRCIHDHIAGTKVVVAE